MTAGKSNSLTLQADGWDIEIDPTCGAGFVRCNFQGQEIFRPRTSAAEAPFDHGNFVLVPYSNRVEQGEFTYRGQQYRLGLNIADHPHQLHGKGWQAEWTVTDQNSHSVELTYRHKASDWIWDYTARQLWTIDGPDLTCALSIMNESTDVMPAGLGIHPYFSGASEAILTFKSDRHYQADEFGIPYKAVPIPADLDFSDGKAVAGTKLDDCFSLLKGQGTIYWPHRKFQLTMTSSPNAAHAIVYSPEGEDFFCFELVTNMNNALNWLERADFPVGIHELAAGETLSETITFHVSPAGAG